MKILKDTEVLANCDTSFLVWRFLKNPLLCSGTTAALAYSKKPPVLFEYHNILEYISNELNLGGVSQ